MGAVHTNRNCSIINETRSIIQVELMRFCVCDAYLLFLGQDSTPFTKMPTSCVTE